MTTVPRCSKCAQPMRQQGRYADWRCDCCDESSKCPHVSGWARLMRKLAGRRV